MTRNEFDLIRDYFARQPVKRRDVALGIGDDCALVEVPEGCQLVVTTDTLVEGTHFLPTASASDVAHKALASNLSDLAAMGAMPAWCSLALTLPEPDDAWVAGFCQGFTALAEHFQVQLIGGDTTRGPKSITITLHGHVPKGQALTRAGAKPGDWLFVTGTLGESQAGLDYILGKPVVDKARATTLINRHYRAQPRVTAGQALRGIASAAIDISDGLHADLTHILTASGVGAKVDVTQLPLSESLLAEVGDTEQAQKLALTSGEEYELCFTVPEMYRGMLDTTLKHSGVNVQCIGQITGNHRLELVADSQPLDWVLSGWDHFKEPRRDRS
ncbi:MULTISPECIES: thiamine-phosphate kinase [Salinivibrio]|uniref:Thiamine-monophosphate kinase n=1 Tax=Salinivibrio siamensis TaxID=414286 RepID=A0ABX3KBT8_9GAMM|nr:MULTISPECIES: thiamine-phosphate kinase [Salinivibrio]KKA44471.1 thiamine monophosphate kinase [Salinivibrio sp. KP-1]OOE80181.1 thiamine-monophosphate kinase [Salinivibrio sp. ML198]OOE86338.1 thiamine-monophosphate kinase [Salinivibrio siamensis]